MSQMVDLHAGQNTRRITIAQASIRSVLMRHPTLAARPGRPSIDLSGVLFLHALLAILAHVRMIHQLRRESANAS